MLLADVELRQDCLHIQTLDKPYRAELHSCFVVWVAFLCFAVVVGPGIYGLSILAQPPGTPRSAAPFGWHDFILLTGLLTLMVLANAAPIIMDMRYSLAYDLDKGRNCVMINSKEIGRLTATDVRLQDSIAFNRRAFRIMANVAGRDYVIVRTQRVNTDTLTGRNTLYCMDATFEGATFKYSYGRWRDYAGAKTGFDPKWPEYVEIFALFAIMREFIGNAKNRDT